MAKQYLSKKNLASSAKLAILIASSLILSGTAVGAPISGTVTQARRVSVPLIKASICSDLVPEDVQNDIGDRITRNDRIDLQNAIVLFAPSKPTTVDTKFASVKLDSDCVALVAVSDDGLSVYDLEDRHKHSVSIELPKQKITLAPGHHMLLTGKAKLDFNHVNPFAAIAHRNLVVHAVSKDLTMFQSEYSIPSAIDAISALKKLFQSHDKTTTRLCERMLKTAAILQVARTSYRFYIPTTLVRR